MTLFKTSWYYNKKHESTRIMFVLFYLKQHFYQQKGFYVLPENINKSPKSIILPRLPVLDTHFYINDKSLTFASFLQKNNHFIDIIESQLPDLTVDFTTLKDSWESNQTSFIKIFKSIFPKIHLPQCLNIYMTNYGSICSQFSTELNKKDTLNIYLRNDAALSNLAEAILMIPFNTVDKSFSYLSSVTTWEEREAIIDFILSCTDLSTIFNNFGGTIQTLRGDFNRDLMSASDNYLASLGYPKVPLFSTGDKVIYFEKKPIKSLTKNELKFLSLLVKNKNKIVSIDNLADELWGDNDEKFSINAVSKLCERVRKKLKAQGLFPAFIRTVKDQGYMLLDTE